VLDAVRLRPYQLLVTFGSIIGRAGLRGEAHYATANDWMTELALRFGAGTPDGQGGRAGVVGVVGHGYGREARRESTR